VAIWTEEGATAAICHASQFVRNYLAHFNPIFLFLSGDELTAPWDSGDGATAS
jgi:hypothetical protein